jgi:hypothetical protein
LLTQVKDSQYVFYLPQRFLVPLFQRPYVWSQEAQWEPSWRDVVRLAERQLAGWWFWLLNLDEDNCLSDIRRDYLDLQGLEEAVSEYAIEIEPNIQDDIS